MYGVCYLYSIRKTNNLIKLFQSLAKPHHYMFGSLLTSVGKPASHYTRDCFPKQFQPAFEDFKKYFKKKTGVDWDE